MTSVSLEQTLIDNSFGVVTNKRVIYMAKKGWFSSRRIEAVPLKQVISIRHETHRNIFLGLFLIVLGIFTIAFMIGIIPLVLGVLLLWGAPTVDLITADETGSPVPGLPWETQEAKDFVHAVRGQLFSE